MRGKRGTSGWTMGKLLSVILLAIVLILVIYGISTGGFAPLKDRLVGMYDSVLLLFGFGDGVGDGCFTGEISSFSGGQAMVDAVGSDGKLTVCEGYCQVNMDKNIYREIDAYKLTRKTGFADDFAYWDKTGKKWVHIFLDGTYDPIKYYVPGYQNNLVKEGKLPAIEEYEIYHGLLAHLKRHSTNDKNDYSFSNPELLLPARKPSYQEGAIWFNSTCYGLGEVTYYNKDKEAYKHCRVYLYDGLAWYKVLYVSGTPQNGRRGSWWVPERWNVMNRAAIDRIYVEATNGSNDDVDWYGVGFFSDLKLGDFYWNNRENEDMWDVFYPKSEEFFKDRVEYGAKRDAAFKSVIDGVVDADFSFDGEEYDLSYRPFTLPIGFSTGDTAATSGNENYGRETYMVYFKKGDKYYGIANFIQSYGDGSMSYTTLYESDDGRTFSAVGEDPYDSARFLSHAPEHFLRAQKEAALYTFFKGRGC